VGLEPEDAETERAKRRNIEAMGYDGLNREGRDEDGAVVRSEEGAEREAVDEKLNGKSDPRCWEIAVAYPDIYALPET